MPGYWPGLKFCQGLIENFWDTLYPELEDGDAEFRVAPLDWIGSRFDQPVRMVPVTRKGYDWFQYKQSRAVGYEADAAGNETKQEARTQAIADGKVTAEDFDSAFAATPKAFYAESKQNLDDCLEAIESLSGVCESKFGEASARFRKSAHGARKRCGRPSMVCSRRSGSSSRMKNPKPASKAAGTESGEAETADAAAVPGRARKTVSAEPADRDDAFSRVAVVAKYLRREDPYSPAPYLMLRGFRWGELRARGDSPSLELLAPPATQVRQDLKRLSVEGNWAELIEARRERHGLPCGRAWLDLQRYAVKATRRVWLSGDRQTPSGRSCARCGRPATIAAVDSGRRHPDGQLRNAGMAERGDDAAPGGERVAGHAIHGGNRKPIRTDRARPVPPDAFQVAMEAARSGDVQLAIEILSREIAHERSGRARFQRKIQLAQICMSTGHEAIAYPILNEMADEIEQRKLEEWEASEVVAHPLALLFRCMNQLDGDAEIQAQAVRPHLPSRPGAGAGLREIDHGAAGNRRNRHAIGDRAAHRSRSGVRKADPPQTRAQSVRQLKAALRRDLEWLLNTRQIAGGVPEAFPGLEGSLYGYGLPDVSNLSGQFHSRPQSPVAHAGEHRSARSSRG